MSPNHSPAYGTSRIVLLGCGRMGFALLKGWLGSGVPAETIQVVEPAPSESLVTLASTTGVQLLKSDEGRPARILVLAVKPQMIAEAAPLAGRLLEQDSLVLSIMAGVPITQLRGLFPAAASIVRAMPNLAAMVGQGASVLIAEDGSTAGHVLIAEELLKTVGTAEWLPGEELIDAATALSGSGPAYAFYLVECLAKAGANAGLPGGIAARLARATMQGAGALLTNSTEEPDHLRRQVTSPGGTTEAGLAVLMRDERLLSLVDETVAAAAQRSRELGNNPHNKS